MHMYSHVLALVLVQRFNTGDVVHGYHACSDFFLLYSFRVQIIRMKYIASDARMFPQSHLLNMVFDLYSTKSLNLYACNHIKEVSWLGQGMNLINLIKLIMCSTFIQQTSWGSFLYVVPVTLGCHFHYIIYIHNFYFFSSWLAHVNTIYR